MSLRRSFGCWRLAIYKDAAHDGAEKGVPGGTQAMIGMAFQGRCPWLISGAPTGRFAVPDPISRQRVLNGLLTVQKVRCARGYRNGPSGIEISVARC